MSPMESNFRFVHALSNHGGYTNHIIYKGFVATLCGVSRYAEGVSPSFATKCNECNKRKKQMDRDLSIISGVTNNESE